MRGSKTNSEDSKNAFEMKCELDRRGSKQRTRHTKSHRINTSERKIHLNKTRKEEKRKLEMNGSQREPPEKGEMEMKWQMENYDK